MIVMTREVAQELLNNITSKGLYTVVVFFRSPITDKVEERHMYADANAEVWAVADTWKATYDKLGFNYIIYVNNSIEYSNNFHGFEFD